MEKSRASLSSLSHDSVLERLRTALKTMSYCGIVEARSLEDAFGATCGRSAESACSDCGTTLCLAHSERCQLCGANFCQACLTFHQKEHQKPVEGERQRAERRKTA